jgi:hypothetical protein
MKAIKLVVGERLALALLLAESDSISDMPDHGEELVGFQRGLANNLRIRMSQLEADDDAFNRLAAAVKADHTQNSALRKIVNSQNIIEAQLQQGVMIGLGNGSLNMEVSEAIEGDYCLLPDSKLALALALANIQQPNRVPHDAMTEARSIYRSFLSDGGGEMVKAAAATIESSHPGWSSPHARQLVNLMDALLSSRAISTSDIGPMVDSGELVFSKV